MAATLIAKMPVWIPIVRSTTVAIMTAYAVAVNLDSKIRTMAKLHYAWTQIGNGHKRLWKHVYSEAAANELEDFRRREHEMSQVSMSEAPNDSRRLSQWQEQVFELHYMVSA